MRKPTSVASYVSKLSNGPSGPPLWGPTWAAFRFLEAGALTERRRPNPRRRGPPLRYTPPASFRGARRFSCSDIRRDASGGVARGGVPGGRKLLVAGSVGRVRPETPAQAARPSRPPLGRYATAKSTAAATAAGRENGDRSRAATVRDAERWHKTTFVGDGEPGPVGRPRGQGGGYPDGQFW